MKPFLKLVTLLFLVSCPDLAVGSPEEVLVYVRCSSNEPAGPILRFAESMASAMFQQASVRVIWRSGSHEPPRSVVVDIVRSTPSELDRQNVLAYARAFEGVHIKIFWDRLAKLGQHGTSSRLLAHVLVHEITHVLERLNRHSEEGVMKARWTAYDLRLMARAPLPFDSDELQFLHQATISRNEAPSWPH